MHFLLTRPDAEGSAAALTARGHRVTLAPLMAFEPVAWHADPPRAIMVTSPQGARTGVPGEWRGLPVYAVGDATAAAATAAGFRDVRAGGGTVQKLVDRIAADGVTRALHLAGADRTAVALPAGLHIDSVTVYRARLLPLPALPVVDWVLLYSARTAAHFAAEIGRLGIARATVSIGVLSPAIADAAGPGWHRRVIALQPVEAALLAAIEAACQRDAAGSCDGVGEDGR